VTGPAGRRPGPAAPGAVRTAARAARRRRALAPALVLGALALAACGKKGPPVAPETRLPRPVADLAGIVTDQAVELTWTNPSRRADGSRLRDLALVRVFRHEDEGTGPPKAALRAGRRVVGYTEVAALRLPVPPGTPGVAVEGDRVRLTDRRGLVRGRRYTYVVVAEDSTGRASPPSNRVAVPFVAPPEPPTGLRAAPGEGEARLTWTPPARYVDGSPITAPLLYEVLRAPAPGAPPEVATPAPIEAPAFVDRGLQNDRTYVYTVRALRRADGTLARGEPSAPAEATPRDVTPPAPPTDLVAAPSPGTVRLSWRPSPDADVAAYAVYRAPAGGDFVRVGSVRAPATVFVDRDVPAGRYRYAVTALDSAAQPNESPPSPPVTVTVP